MTHWGSKDRIGEVPKIKAIWKYWGQKWQGSAQKGVHFKEEEIWYCTRKVPAAAVGVGYDGPSTPALQAQGTLDCLGSVWGWRANYFSPLTPQFFSEVRNCSIKIVPQLVQGCVSPLEDGRQGLSLPLKAFSAHLHKRQYIFIFISSPANR